MGSNWGGEGDSNVLCLRLRQPLSDYKLPLARVRGPYGHTSSSTYVCIVWAWGRRASSADR